MDTSTKIACRFTVYCWFLLLFLYIDFPIHISMILFHKLLHPNCISLGIRIGLFMSYISIKPSTKVVKLWTAWVGESHLGTLHLVWFTYWYLYQLIFQFIFFQLLTFLIFQFDHLVQLERNATTIIFKKIPKLLIQASHAWLGRLAMSCFLIKG